MSNAMRDWIELVITVGVPVGGVLWLLVRLQIRNEVQTMQHSVSEKFMTELKAKPDKADVDTAFKRLFDIVDEMRAQMVDVLVEFRGRNNGKSNNHRD